MPLDVLGIELARQFGSVKPWEIRDVPIDRLRPMLEVFSLERSMRDVPTGKGRLN